MFISRHYATKLWTNHEREAAQARAFLEHEEYILPVRLDDTQLPGMPPTIGYLSWPPETARTLADAIVTKLGKVTSHRMRKAGEGNTASVAKHYAEMLAAYKQVILLDAKDPYAFILKGEALYELERFEEALDAYEQALRLDSGNIYLYITIGQILQDLGRFEEALDAYNYYLEHVPNDSSNQDISFAEGCKSFVLYELEQLEEALKSCERSVQLDSDDAIMQGQRGVLLYLLDRSDEALDACEQAIQLDHTQDWVFVTKGDALYELERFQEAVDAYEYAIQLDFAYFSAYKGKGNAFYKLKLYQEALVAYNRAIQLNPEDADSYIRKGNTLKHILENQKVTRKVIKKTANSIVVDSHQEGLWK